MSKRTTITHNRIISNKKELAIRNVTAVPRNRDGKNSAVLIRMTLIPTAAKAQEPGFAESPPNRPIYRDGTP